MSRTGGALERDSKKVGVLKEKKIKKRIKK